ncbi:MAG: glycosyltransferase family 87 protein [Myxococcota bacterium]
MSPPPRRLVASRRVVERLALGWAVLLLVVFAWRLAFPLELEWMEGGLLHQARRIQLGQSPYPPPGADYVPFLYTPLYSVVLAGLGFVVPLGYALGRAVSILAWVATGLALWHAVRGEDKPRAHAAAAVGLACAGYVFTFRWLDLARPDTLHIALVTWALVLLRRSGPRASLAVWAGVLMALAFWTKQTAASFVIASGLGVLLVNWRRFGLYAGTIALLDGAGVLLGNWLTEGWLWTYIYELHQSHAFNHERFTTKTWGMFVHAWPAVTVVVFGLVSVGLGRVPARLRRWRASRHSRSGESGESGESGAESVEAGVDSESGASNTGVDASSKATEIDPARGGRARAYWTLMALAGLLVSALGYSTQWAEPNAFIPGVVLGALALAVALPVGGWGEVLSLALVALQLLSCLFVEPLYHPVQKKGLAGLSESYAWQDPWRTLPDAEVWERASALRAEIEACPGEIFALHRPWWSVLAGGDGHVGSMGVTDVGPEERRTIEKALRESVKQGRYAWVWVEGEAPRWLAGALLRGYRVERRRHGAQRVRPMSGYMSEAGMVTPYRRDQLLLVPRGPRPLPAGATVVADFEDRTLDGFATEGPAFGRPQRGSPRSLPLAGPYGGEYLLTSAGVRGDLKLTGTATSPLVSLPEKGHLEMLLGFAGRRPRGLSVWLEEDGGGGRTVRLDVPATPHSLSTVRWEITPAWSGVQIRVRLADHSPKAALYFDDLWVVEQADPR